jgi:hypothetical protein
VVRQVAARVIDGGSLYPLHHGGDRPPVAAKVTVNKIRDLVRSGRLDPLLEHWGLKSAPEEEPTQFLHLAAFRTFLQNDERVRGFFSVSRPEWALDIVLPQVVGGSRRLFLPTRRASWEELPIVGKIRQHCPQNQLWSDIEEWKRRNSEYRTAASRMAQELHTDFTRRLPFPPATIADREQETKLLLDISKWVTGQLLGDVPHHGHFRSKITLDAKVGEPWHFLVWDGTSYAKGTESQIESAAKAANDMLDEWAESGSARLLVHQYHSLIVLGEKIRKEIDDIDEAVLSQGTCPDCPIARAR